MARGQWGGGRLLKSISTTFSSVSATAGPFGAQTYQIRVASTLPVWFRIGDGSQTAVANTDQFLPGSFPDYFTVSPGQQIGFISTSTSSGYMSIGEME